MRILCLGKEMMCGYPSSTAEGGDVPENSMFSGLCCEKKYFYFQRCSSLEKCGEEGMLTS